MTDGTEPGCADASWADTEARFARFCIGDVEAVVLNDGGVLVPSPPGAPGQAAMVLRPLACLLVRLPGASGLVLIDSGFGPVAKRAGEPLPTAGRLLASLAAAGIAREEIGTVLISHVHPDHVDGLYLDDGTATFPNAAYRVSAEELSFWRQDGLNLSWSPSPPAFKAEMLAASRRLLAFAGASLQTFRAGEPAIPGIGTMLLPGHTPGQTGFVIATGSGQLLYTPDALTTIEMSVAAPERQNPIDLDPELGVKTRKMLLERVARSGWHSFSPHFAWPNLGTIRSAGQRYVWTPAK